MADNGSAWSGECGACGACGACPTGQEAAVVLEDMTRYAGSDAALRRYVLPEVGPEHRRDVLNYYFLIIIIIRIISIVIISSSSYCYYFKMKAQTFLGYFINHKRILVLTQYLRQEINKRIKV